MDEAKSLVHMSVSAIFAAMLLGAVAGLIGLSYTMWNYFSRQDLANSRLAYYSNLTAFDNTTLRGSEVLSLLSEADQLGIYVLFLNTNDTAPTSTTLDEITLVAPTNYFYCNTFDAKYNMRMKDDTYVNDKPICKAAIDWVQATINTGKSLDESSPYSANMNNSFNLYNRSRAELISVLTNKTQLGSCVLDDSYGVFKSTLIYANDGTTEVVGVVLVRVANSQITDYCED